VLDGELVALKDGDPWFLSVCDRILHGRKLPIVFMVFDPLYADQESLLRASLREATAAARGSTPARPAQAGGSGPRSALPQPVTVHRRGILIPLPEGSPGA
jgi:hypothetical protein